MIHVVSLANPIHKPSIWGWFMQPTKIVIFGSLLDWPQLYLLTAFRLIHWLFSFQDGSSSLKLVDLLWNMHLFSPTKVLWFVNCLADSCFCWISAEKATQTNYYSSHCRESFRDWATVWKLRNFAEAFWNRSTLKNWMDPSTFWDLEDNFSARNGFRLRFHLA